MARVAGALGLLLLLPLAGIGLAVAGLRLFKPTVADGWTGIADGLGALMLGSAGGLVVALAILIARRGRPLRGALIGSATLAVIAIGALALVPKQRIALPDRPTPFEPDFAVQLYTRIAAADPGPSVDAGNHPYRELRVSARDRRLSTKGWGNAERRRYCSAEPDELELGELAELARRLFEARPANCAADGPGFTLTVEWQGASHVAGCAPSCFDPTLVAFLDRFAAIEARHCATD